ncbi:transcriptional regulator, AlpA family [Cooperia oncophora]
MVWHEKSSNVCGEGLQLALMANREFWSTYDPEDKSTAPTKHEADSSLQDMINAGKFPKGFKIGLRRVGWYEDEVLAWLKEREEEARGTAA